MLEKLKLVETRYLEMAERAAQPDFYNDAKAAAQLLKEQLITAAEFQSEASGSA